jgi:hypothetical protein
MFLVIHQSRVVMCTLSPLISSRLVSFGWVQWDAAALHCGSTVHVRSSRSRGGMHIEAMANKCAESHTMFGRSGATCMRAAARDVQKKFAAAESTRQPHAHVDIDRRITPTRAHPCPRCVSRVRWRVWTCVRLTVRTTVNSTHVRSIDVPLESTVDVHERIGELHAARPGHGDMNNGRE